MDEIGAVGEDRALLANVLRSTSAGCTLLLPAPKDGADRLARARHAGDVPATAYIRIRRLRAGGPKSVRPETGASRLPDVLFRAHELQLLPQSGSLQHLSLLLRRH